MISPAPARKLSERKWINFFYSGEIETKFEGIVRKDFFVIVLLII